MWLQLGIGVGTVALVGLLLWAAYRSGKAAVQKDNAEESAKRLGDDLEIAARPTPDPDSIIERMRRGEM